MNKQEQWLIALGLLFAGGPVAAFLIYLILEPQDFSRPITWLLVLLLVAMFIWDPIAKMTYRSTLDRWLDGKGRYLQLFADETERMLPLGLFLVGLFMADENAPKGFGGSVVVNSIILLSMLIAISAVWAADRSLRERRSKR